MKILIDFLTEFMALFVSQQAFAADTPSQQKHEFAKLTYYSIALGVVAAVAFVLQVRNQDLV